MEEHQVSSIINETGFRHLFESAPGLYLVLLPDLTIHAVSDSYTNATMTKRKEIIGRHLFDVFPDNPEDATADGVSNLRYSLNAVLKNKSAHTMAVQKYDIRRPDGTFEERYWSPLNKPVLNVKNEVVYIIHRVEDVTDFVRLQKEQKLKDKLTDDLRSRTREMEIDLIKRSQELQKLNDELERRVNERTEQLVNSSRLYAFLSAINQSIVHIDSVKKLFDNACNIAVRTGKFKASWISMLDEKGRLNMISIFGDELVVKELQKYSGRDYCSPELRDTTSGKALRTGKYVVKNDVQNDPDMKSFNDLFIRTGTNAITSLPLYKSGKVVGIYGFYSAEANFFDEDELNLLVEAAGDISFALENFEKEALQKKMDEELIISNAELKKINGELDRFVYSVSHELRSPLTSVMGLFGVMNNKNLEAENKEILDLINKSVLKMDETLKEILDYSRNARNIIKTEWIDFKDIINGAFENSSYHQEEFRFENRINIKEMTPFFSDLARIKVIISNLISNSLKYGRRDNTAFIEINITVDEKELILEIADNGIGIKEELQQNIFGMFYRATIVGSGSGLGLYIVKESIEKLKGTINVESVFGRGSKFIIKIPNNINPDN